MSNWCYSYIGLIQCPPNGCNQYISELEMIPEGKGVKTEEELAKFRAEKRKNRKENHLKAFHLNITPEQYRGMIFLGNFKSQDQSNTLKDPRVAHLHHELFLNKAVLDLGAGDGAVAIEVAMRMLPRKIVALEIDAELIAIAKRRVDKIILNSEKYRAVREDLELQKTLSEFPLFFQQAARKIEERHTLKLNRFLQIIPENLPIEQEFPRNLCFLNDNFFNLDTSTQYDTILCLGTVKWIHLALGDSGVEAFFNKIYDLLRFEGILVLEYSYFKSYKQKRSMNELFRKNYADHIKVDPLSFPSLLKFVGLELVETIEGTAPLHHPLQIFKKPTLPCGTVKK